MARIGAFRAVTDEATVQLPVRVRDSETASSENSNQTAEQSHNPPTLYISPVVGTNDVYGYRAKVCIAHFKYLVLQ